MGFTRTPVCDSLVKGMEAPSPWLNLTHHHNLAALFNLTLAEWQWTLTIVELTINHSVSLETASVLNIICRIILSDQWLTRL